MVKSKRKDDPPMARSKFFSIDSYFKDNNKKVKLTSVEDGQQQQVEQAIQLSLQQQHNEETSFEVDLRKEQCPLCQTFIFVESVSMEVHVNACLDSQQEEKENTPPTTSPFFSKSSNSSGISLNLKKESVCLNESNKEIIEKKQIEVLKEEEINIEKKPIDHFKQKEADHKENDVAKEQDEKTSTGLLDRILPTSWKSMFTATDTNVALPLDIKNVNVPTSSSTAFLSNKAPKVKACPFYKRVRDTRFVVDAFSYGKISNCDGYFLTHYHSDHYGGLRGSWSHGPIYCSQVTANLVKQELGVNRTYVRPLPMNELCPIPGSNVTVALIDANHCPGSVLFLFIIQHSDGRKSRHLHTGDFRASPRMCLHPLIRQPENGPIHCLYLDTTYLNPQYAFPAQEECIKAVCDLVEQELELSNNMAVEAKKKPSLLENWISKSTPSPPAPAAVVEPPNEPENAETDPMTVKNVFKLMMSPTNKTTNKSRVLIVVGTYTIGKERVFFNIAKMLKCKIFATAKKRRILKCQEDEELNSMLTTDPTEAQVHVVSLRDIRGDIMSKYLEDHKSSFDSLIAFKPTGWTYKSTKVQTSDMKLAPLSHIIIPPSDRSLHLTPYYKSAKMKFYGVPYSEHSSFRELASFIASLDIQHIIPTVNISQVKEMSDYFTKWEQEKLSKRTEVVPYPNEDHW